MTDPNIKCGIYGKLPAHGDFISRNLPAAFLNNLDDWLQGFIAASQEQLTEDWLDIYLTSPVWRFVFSRGCVDGNCWAGVMIPSVDSVGRYFPFCVVYALSEDTNLIDVLSTHAQWFDDLEQLVLDALDNEYDADTVLDKAIELQLNSQSFFYRRTDSHNSEDAYNSNSENVALVMDFEEQLPSSTHAALLDWFMSKRYASYSLWHSKGSDRVQPSFLISQGLPSLGGAAGMLQGDWQHWNWKVPFELATDVMEEEEFIF